jgi:hypothetical protein
VRAAYKKYGTYEKTAAALKCSRITVSMSKLFDGNPPEIDHAM